VLDFEQKLDVLAPVQAAPGFGLFWREARKFGLPIAQDIRFDGQQTGHFADPKVQLVRYLGCLTGYFQICHQPSVILPYSARIVTTLRSDVAKRAVNGHAIPNLFFIADVFAQDTPGMMPISVMNT
jgi:hypothetical protein